MSFSSQVIMLLRTLLHAPKWRQTIIDQVISSLKPLPAILLGNDDESTASSSQNPSASSSYQSLPSLQNSHQSLPSMASIEKRVTPPPIPITATNGNSDSFISNNSSADDEVEYATAQTEDNSDYGNQIVSACAALAILGL